MYAEIKTGCIMCSTCYIVEPGSEKGLSPTPSFLAALAISGLTPEAKKVVTQLSQHDSNVFKFVFTAYFKFSYLY